MIEIKPLEIIIIVLYFAILLLIGYITKKGETISSFMIAERKLNSVQVGISIIAVLGGLFFAGQTTLAYEIGFSAMWFWLGVSLGMLGLIFLIPKVYRVSKEKNLVNINEYFKATRDIKNQIISAIILFLTFFTLLAGQFVVGGAIISELIGVSYMFAILSMGIITLIYLLLGGFKTVIRTDVIQFIFLFIVFIFITIFTNKTSITFTQIIKDSTPIGSFGALSFILIGIVAVFGAGDFWQRIIAAKNSKTAQKSCLIASVLFLIIGFSITLLGIYTANNFTDIDPNDALFYGLFELIPESLFILSILILLSAIMSTIDTELFFLSSSIVKDFINPFKEIKEKSLPKIMKMTMICIAVTSMIFAIFITDIVLIMFSLISLSTIIGVILIANIFYNPKTNAIFLGMAVGLISFSILFFSGTLTPDNSVITIPATAIGLLIGELIFKKKN